MSTLYIDCGAGASKDCIAASLADLTGAPDELSRTLESSGIPGLRAELSKETVNGTTGLRLRILIDGKEEGQSHEHVHRRLSDIEETVGGLNLSERVKKDILGIYVILAEAEAKAHGRPVGEVHFHEVGSLFAVAHIAASCIAMDMLSPDTVIASPIRTGYGEISCAHGILSVPAPATANILRGIPSYAGDDEGEFCTPTGAAIVRHFADGFSDAGMEAGREGYGSGRRMPASAPFLRTAIGRD